MNIHLRREGRTSDRRGASLVLTVVMRLGVLAVLALAIDLGMLFTARAEAQRAAARRWQGPARSRSPSPPSRWLMRDSVRTSMPRRTTSGAR